MQIGDLVYDVSVCMSGLIVYTKMWTLIGVEEPEYEHTIMYEDGTLNTAYEYELLSRDEEE